MKDSSSSKTWIANAIIAATLLTVSLFTLSGCALEGVPKGESSAATEQVETQDTSKVLSSLAWGQAQTINGVIWDGSKVTTSVSESAFTVTTNSIPNHERDAYYAVPNQGVVVPDEKTSEIAQDPTRETDLTFSFPTSPIYSTATTAAPLGSIGMMISGSVLYNPFEGDGKTVAMSSNFTITQGGVSASFVDHCSGHPTPQGAYHYHANSACVTRQVDQQGGASHLIGVALDGFPIYGAYDLNGVEIQPNQLDECNGIFSPTPEFPSGIYHYVLPNTSDETSSIRCFHGVVDTSQIQQMPPMMGG